MKYLLAFIALMPLTVLGATVINYDDGSTYTLKEGEKIYISKSKLFKQKNYTNGNVHFTLQKEHSARDYVADPDGTDDMEVGSHEWCQAYVPWHEGLTFDMIWWQRGCDSNGDGVYDENDNKWPDGEG